jgi:hypothetical protein
MSLICSKCCQRTGVKVKVTLEQATKVERGARWWMGGQRQARPLYPRERPGTYCIGGWVGPRVGLDGCGKSQPYQDSIPGPSSP